MSGPLFSGSIADFYERELVPILFESYADDLVARVGDAGSILELAAGTGVVTRRLDRALPKASILATDLSPDMLRIAAQHAPHATTRTADATDLPFDDAAFDTVVCQFGVMFFPDKGRSFREAYRVLKPRGRYIFNVWRSLEHNEFADSFETALRPMLGRPSYLARIAYGYDEPDEIRAGLEAAGFRTIDIQTVERVLDARSVQHLVDAFAIGSPVAKELAELDAGARDRAIASAVRSAQERFGAEALKGRAAALVVQAERA